MNNRFFERPILNSPYAYPIRHWELDETGQPTQQIIETRRRADFITPIPKPKKRKGAALQGSLVFDEGKGLSTAEQRYDHTASLARMVQFAEAFPEEKIVATLSQQLGWSHVVEILPPKQLLQREYYAEMCAVERWRMTQCAHSNGKGGKEDLKCQIGISSSPGLAPARDVMRSRFVTALNVKVFNSSQTMMSSQLVESLKSQIVISNREVRSRAQNDRKVCL